MDAGKKPLLRMKVCRKLLKNLESKWNILRKAAIKNWVRKCTTVFHCCYMFLIFFLKIQKFALETASSKNQHCASSIDTLSILVRHAHIFNKLLNAINLYLILIFSSRHPMPVRLVVQSYFFQQLSSLC